MKIARKYQRARTFDKSAFKLELTLTSDRAREVILIHEVKRSLDDCAAEIEKYLIDGGDAYKRERAW